ncbi:MAG: nuclear transport factor 2 family protein [Gammaproteobacteria bacterium]|nr:nuclear transport factor 2 family protein [Gammaproteobacteria bacterium]
MSDTDGVVKAYLHAIAARNFELARSYLCDRGFRYVSPIGNFDNADRFIDNLVAVGSILERLEIRQCMISGNQALAVLDAVITLRGYVSKTIAVLFRVEGGKIRTIEAIFDASDYHRMFA